MNVLENIPYTHNALGKRKLVDENHLLIMQIALKSGQTVPEHKADSNLHLLVMRGGITVFSGDADHSLREGDLFPVSYQAPMLIKNDECADATFLVIKTPNPSEM